jgi:hypothetical protein
MSIITRKLLLVSSFGSLCERLNQTLPLVQVNNHACVFFVFFFFVIMYICIGHLMLGMCRISELLGAMWINTGKTRITFKNEESKVITNLKI